MRLLRGFALAILIAALLPAGASALGRAQRIKGAGTHPLEEGVKSTSVAIAPDGTPWFGLETRNGKGPELARVTAGKLSFVSLGPGTNYSSTTSLRFDAAGNLWFIRDGAVQRRSPDGTVTELDLPGGSPATSLAFDAEGNVWFARWGGQDPPSIGRSTPAGSVTEWPLPTDTGYPTVAVGPDGAIWFTEPEANEIGRITASGEIAQFPLGAGVEPRQIVAGPDGAIWFAENGVRHKHRLADRIGRLATDGAVTQFPIPFGGGTEALTVDPRGFIWFTTDEGEISSISTAGVLGARGCAEYCGGLLQDIRVGPTGALWLAVGTPFCLGCGGGSDLIAENEGTQVLKIPAGALRPAAFEELPAEEQPAPTARTLRPYGVNGTEAVLNGFINPHGLPATYRFKWGKTKAYGHLAPDEAPEMPVSPSDEGEEIEEVVWGLCPRTTYHFEIVAYGPGGRTLGGDRTFRTSASEHPPKKCPKR